MTATPATPRIRRALESLGIPFDARTIGLASMTPERQQSVLLSLLSVHVSGILNNHLIAVDPMTADERYMLNVSTASEVIDGGDAASALSLALYQLIIARDLITEAGRDAAPGESPRHAAVPLIHAAMELIDIWVAAMASGSSFSVGGRKYSMLADAPMDKVLAEVLKAAEGIKAMYGPREGEKP